METIDRRLRENRTEEERKAQTAAATAARKNLPSTREQARENEEIVLRWIGSWGFTSPNILKQLVGAQSLKTIEKNKLISRLDTDTTYTPHIYKLTKLGIQILAEMYDCDLSDSYVEVDSSRIRLDKIRHELTTQHLTLEKQLEFAETPRGFDFFTEREYYVLEKIIKINGKNFKIPDVIWQFMYKGDLKRYAIEVELTKKGSIEPSSSTRYKLDQFIERVVASLERKDFDAYVIYSRNKGLLADYQSVFGAGKSYSIYEKDRYGKPYVLKRLKISEEVAKKMAFLEIENNGRNL
jgi:DNA-binding HxlR family transcriptional regulator